jgi:lipopolysaccharide assembly outer membrane protein LptD (OstA)
LLRSCLTALLLLPVPGAWAQEPAPTPASPAAAEDQPTCSAEEPCITSARQEKLSREHARFTGFVDMQFGDARIQADDLDVYTSVQPDGTEAHRIEARSNVVFLRGDERLAGERLVLDLRTGRGSFENAVGYVSPGVFIEARKIERVDADTYEIEGGRFTSCSQPTPRWSFSSSSATLDVDDEIRARNVVFRVKRAPAFYIPFFMYPIQEDQRASGLLFPRFGTDSRRGKNIGTGFFWAMGRSSDQTFYFDHWTQYGQGYGHELRYVRGGGSRGNFTTRFVRRKATELSPLAGWEYDLNWAAAQTLPGQLKASLRVQESSSLLFQEQFQEDLDLASRRTRFSTASLQRSFGATSVLLLADSADTFFSDSDEFDRRRHLPTLEVSQSSQKLGRTGLVLSYEARAENLALGNQDRVDTYGRYDLMPRLSRPLSVSFLQLTPEVVYRYTAYGVSDLELDDNVILLSGPAVSRRYGETSVDMRGPTFSRVFDTEGNFYSDRFKHVIGPEVTWTYRSRVDLDLLNALPFFDERDRVPGTNEVRYALVQRLYAKRRGGSGKLEPYEFFNWRVGQTYYLDPNASLYDPGYNSSAFGPGGDPASFSPLQSRLRFRPTPRLSSNFDLEYDVNFKQLKYVSLSGNVNYPRAAVQATWYRGNRLAGRADRRGVSQDTISGNARLFLVPGRFALDGSAYYDLVTKAFRGWTARARYDVQCCGFLVEMIESGFNTGKRREFRYGIELANIGMVGNYGQGEGYGRRSAR